MPREHYILFVTMDAIYAAATKVGLDSEISWI
jgi:hypothetical protein